MSAVVVAGAADVGPLPATDEGPVGLARRVDAFARGAVALLGEAGVTGAVAERAGCVLGTAYGTSHVAEHVLTTLDTRGHRFIDPEAFLLFAPQGVTSALCIAAGLGGSAATLAGAGAGAAALAMAVASVSVGRDPVVVCGAFDWPSPFGAAAVADLTAGPVPTQGGTVLLVVEDEAHATARGAPVLGRVQPGDGPPAALPAGVVPSVAGLLPVVEALGAGRGTVVVDGGVARVAVVAAGG